MKKILLLIAAFALLGTIVSCSSDDEPKRGDGVFVVNTPMVNHIYNTKTNEVIGLGNTHNKLVFDTAKHTGSLELNYNDGSDHTLSLQDLVATPKRQGFYELRSPSYAQFRGYVDLNEGSMRYIYTSADGIRVISTIREVFFYKTHNNISYDDTTTATDMDNVYYRFTITPGMENAVVKIGDIVHAKDLKSFISITAMSVPYTLTANGYELAGENIATTARYVVTLDSTFTHDRSTTDYPFKIFHATVDLLNDYLEAEYMMGSSATVVASGSTYPDYTSY